MSIHMVKGYSLPPPQMNGVSLRDLGMVTYDGAGQVITNQAVAQRGSLMATTQQYERDLLDGRAPDPYAPIPALHGYDDVRGYIELAGLGEFDDASGAVKDAYEMRDVTPDIQTGNVLSLGPPPDVTADHSSMTGTAVTDAAGRIIAIIPTDTGPSLATLLLLGAAAYFGLKMFNASRRRVRRA